MLTTNNIIIPVSLFKKSILIKGTVDCRAGIFKSVFAVIPSILVFNFSISSSNFVFNASKSLCEPISDEQSATNESISKSLHSLTQIPVLASHC